MRGLILIIIGLLMLGSVFIISSFDNSIYEVPIYEYEEKVNLIQEEEKEEFVELIEKPIIKVENSHVKKIKDNHQDNYEDFNEVNNLEDNNLEDNNLEDIYYSNINELDYNYVSPEVRKKIEKGKVRAVLTFKDEFEKEILNSINIKINNQWKNIVSADLDKEDLEFLEQFDVMIEEDLPLQTMTYEGFDLMDVEKVLVDGRTALADVGQGTTRYLNGTGEYNLTGMNQTVCMIDSGLVVHPEYGNELAGWDFYYNSSLTSDEWNHGSRMGGIIFAKGIKVQGLAYKANYVDLRITDNSGNSWTSHLNNALQWCIDNATKFNITTVYIGVGTALADGTEPGCAYGLTPDQINNLTSMNITVLAPAGHDTNHTHIAYPACVANTISVGGVPSGASGPADIWNLGGGEESNRRDGLLDLLAPGGDGITKTTNNALDYTSGTGIGTSVSTAYVAGLSMLFKEYWDARGWNIRPSGLVNGNIPNTIEYVFKKTGKMIYDPKGNTSYPRVDFYKAIRYEEYKPNLTLQNMPDQQPGIIKIKYNATDKSGIKNCIIKIANQTKNNTNGTVKLNLTSGNYTYNITCYDNSSIPNNITKTNNITIRVFNPPQLNLTNITINEDGNFSLDLWNYTTDKDTNKNNLTYTTENNSLLNCQIGRYLNCTAKKDLNGNTSLNITVTDKTYNVSDILEIIIIPINDAPILNLPNITIDENENITINLTNYSSDETQLNYTQDSTYCIIENKTLKCNYGDEYGNKIIKITADDGELKTTKNLNIYINSINDAPKLYTKNITINEGEKIQITANYTDDSNVTIHYYSPLNSTGGWQTTYKDSGIYNTKITINDGEYNTTKNFTITVNNILVPDFAIINAQIYSIDQFITFDIEIKNIGEKAENVSWKFSSNESEYTYGPFNMKINETINVAPIAKLNTINHTFILDYNNTIPELNETNNIAIIN